MVTNNTLNQPTAATGKILQGQGVGTAANFSTATYPATGTTAGQILRADGTNWVGTIATYPNTAGTTGNVLTSDGTNWGSSATAIASPGTSTDRAIATWNGTTGNALRNNSSEIIDSSGRFTNTLQTAFLASLNTIQTSVTGDGTVVNIPWDTEIFDQGNNFNLGTGVFTAPVTGRYKMDFSAGIGASGLHITAGQITMVTSNRTYLISMRIACGNITSCSSKLKVLADFDAADTMSSCTVQTTDTGGKRDNLNGVVGGNMRTWISGLLAC